MNELRRLRDELNLTQDELGREIGVEKNVISNIENGRQGLSDASALELTNYLSEEKMRKTSFLDGYYKGQRFAKIIGELRKNGLSLQVLRDDIFKVKGSVLSCMYIGIENITPHILAELQKLNVNLDYLENGNWPMFKGIKDPEPFQNFPLPVYRENLIQGLMNFEKAVYPKYQELYTNSKETECFFVVENLPEKTLPILGKGAILGVRKESIFSKGWFLVRVSFDVFLVHYDGKTIVKHQALDKPQQKFNPLNISQRFRITEVRYTL